MQSQRVSGQSRALSLQGRNFHSIERNRLGTPRFRAFPARARLSCTHFGWVSLAEAMQFPTSGLERASKFLINHNIEIRTNSAQSRALEKIRRRENMWRPFATCAVQRPVRRTPPRLDNL